MLITSKRGAQDNIVAYEHICDTTEDLQNINPQYITLGSTCIVVQGENGGVDAYIATSDKQWVPLGSGSDDGSSEEDTKKYENSNVRFIDYDGKVVDGYSAEEFLQLNKMPKNPNHKNDKIPLTAQGWNWSLADIKAYMTKYPDAVMTIGQMYIPTDGKTHMVLDVGPRLTIPLMIQQTVSEGVTINWGDGSEEETIEGTGTVTTSHTYEAEGEYDITLDVADGCTLDFGGTVNDTACNVFGENAEKKHKYILPLKKLYVGDNVTSIGGYAFYGCNALASLTIPDGVTSISGHAFYNCFTLISLTIPDSITSIGGYAFYGCYALISLTIPSSVTSIGNNVFANCYALSRLAIPDGITSIEDNLCRYCYALSTLNIPDSVVSIGKSAFNGCNALVSLTISDDVISIAQSAFNSCNVLVNLTIPDNVTSIDNYVFTNCNSVTAITIPNGVTSIGTAAFYNCFALTSLTIPESVTSISSEAFDFCHSLFTLTIFAETPPTLANVNAFSGMPADCTIYVPHGKGDVYKADSKWSTWASQIQELPE